MSARVSRAGMLAVDVGAHLYPDTVIRRTAYALENRATVRLDCGVGGGVDVTLYAHRAELARLRDALTAVLDELDTERAALAQTLSADESAA